MDQYIYFDGKILPAGSPLISADNRGLRYGDGLFETIKVVNNTILREQLHFERLFQGMELLQFNIPPHCTAASLASQVLQLCKKNKVEKAARVRLTVLRGNGGLYDPEHLHPQIIIQTWALPDNYMQLNENGLVVDVCTGIAKSCDVLSHLKSNNYLPYIMAAFYAKKNRLNDALVLNSHNRVCDTTIANIFLVKDGQLVTPPLSEGCVAGVMRRYLLTVVAEAGYIIKEIPVTIEMIQSANEMFLTNALYGIRWVKQCGEKTYSNQLSAELYRRFVH